MKRTSLALPTLADLARCATLRAVGSANVACSRVERSVRALPGFQILNYEASSLKAARKVKAVEHGCHRLVHGSKGWAVGRGVRQGATVHLGSRELLACGPVRELQAIARFLPAPGRGKGFQGLGALGSRYVVGKVCFKDLSALTQGLEELFGKGSVEVSKSGENTLTPYDYHGQQRTQEIGQVAAVVRRKHIGSASNDLPIRREADGSYRVVVSEYDISHVPTRLGWKGVKTIDEIEGRLNQRAGVVQLRKGLKSEGYTLSETVDEDGTIHVRAHAGVGSRPAEKARGGY